MVDEYSSVSTQAERGGLAPVAAPLGLSRQVYCKRRHSRYAPDNGGSGRRFTGGPTMNVSQPNSRSLALPGSAESGGAARPRAGARRRLILPIGSIGLEACASPPPTSRRTRGGCTTSTVGEELKNARIVDDPRPGHRTRPRRPGVPVVLRPDLRHSPRRHGGRRLPRPATRFCWTSPRSSPSRSSEGGGSPVSRSFRPTSPRPVAHRRGTPYRGGGRRPRAPPTSSRSAAYAPAQPPCSPRSTGPLPLSDQTAEQRRPTRAAPHSSDPLGDHLGRLRLPRQAMPHERTCVPARPQLQSHSPSTARPESTARPDDTSDQRPTVRHIVFPTSYQLFGTP